MLVKLIIEEFLLNQGEEGILCEDKTVESAFTPPPMDTIDDAIIENSDDEGVTDVLHRRFRV